MICHKVRAESALNTISKVSGSASDVLSKIKAQANLIPLNGGTKDELGQNVEAVINDMANTLSSSVIEPLNNITSSRENILTRAQQKDDEERRRLLALAKRKEQEDDTVTVDTFHRIA